MNSAVAHEAQPGVSKALPYYAAFVALGLVGAALGPVLPRVAEQVGVSLSVISIMFTARSFGYLLGSLGAGRLYDRIPSHRVMAAAVALLGSTMLLLPSMPTLGLLVALVFILGIGEGGVDVGGNASIVWRFGLRVGPYMNALHFFFGLGAFIAPLLVAQAVLLTGSYAWSFRLMALLMIPPAVMLLAQDSPIPHRSEADEAGGPVEMSLVVLIVVFLLVYVGAEVSYGGWVFTYATETGLAPEATAAYLTAAFWGALTLGRLLSIPLAMRFRAAMILGGSVAGCVAGIAIANLFPNSIQALWAATLVMGLSMAAIFPTVMTLAGTLMTVTGKVTGWFLVGASLGSMSVPWLVGQLFGIYGPPAIMVTILLDLLLLAALYVVLMLRVRQRRYRMAGTA
jgi:MFS transporter, FHS family, Na+ dependent glucose transporter 1